ncbi:MAG: hypothetical protein IJU57_03925 [Clostridia bacterium]|nr:hypothetical protein [Clostridia bacterium]
MLEINENTKLADIMKEYPWIGDEAVKMSDRLKIINTPLGRAVIARARISDISRKTGFPPELIIEKINEVINAHLSRESSRL